MQQGLSRKKLTQHQHWTLRMNLFATTKLFHTMNPWKVSTYSYQLLERKSYFYGCMTWKNESAGMILPSPSRSIYDGNAFTTRFPRLSWSTIWPDCRKSELAQRELCLPVLRAESADREAVAGTWIATVWILEGMTVRNLRSDRSSKSGSQTPQLMFIMCSINMDFAM